MCNVWEAEGDVDVDVGVRLAVLDALLNMGDEGACGDCVVKINKYFHKKIIAVNYKQLQNKTDTCFTFQLKVQYKENHETNNKRIW